MTTTERKLLKKANKNRRVRRRTNLQRRNSANWKRSTYRDWNSDLRLNDLITASNKI
jgi:hypothetical protein